MKKYHYVYYSYELEGRGYIGKRSCKCTPEQDSEYFGSFSDKTFKPDRKMILATFASSEEALQAEIRLHNFYDVAANPHFANRAKQSSKFFNTEGAPKSSEHKEKIRLSNLGRKRTEESKQRMSAAKMGNHYGRGNRGKSRGPTTLGLRLTVAQRIKKALCGHRPKHKIEVTSPEGISMCPLNMRLFCEENGLSAESIRNIAKGNRHSNRGWTARMSEPF